LRRLRVLYLAANPGATSPLRLDEEIHQIQSRLRGAPLSGRISMSSAWAVRVSDLARTLRETSPAAVHFAGHGTREGIILERGGEARDVKIPVPAPTLDAGPTPPEPVPGTALADLFRLEGRTVRCVVLNACFSEDQARAIADQVPFVVGTRPSIRDRDAIAFSGRFYESIANGATLEEAVEAGGNEIALQGGPPDAYRSFVKAGTRAGSRPLLRAPSALRRAAAAVAIVAAVATAAVWVWPRAQAIAYLNTELVFDATAKMGESLPSGLGDKTKLVAAKEHVAEYVSARSPDNLALRWSKGCDGSEFVVPFQTDAGAKIQDALEGLRTTSGSFPLAKSVIAATGDFNDEHRFPPDRTRRQIIVVTAAGDACGEDPALLAERWDELGWAEPGNDVAVRIDLVGLGVGPSDATELGAMAAAVHGRAWAVQDERQLVDLLDFLLDREPVIDAADAVVDTGNAIVPPLRAFVDAMYACVLDAAHSAQPSAAQPLRQADPALEALAERDSRPAYRQIHRAGVQWVARLGDVFEADEAWLASFEGSTDEQCDSARSTDSWKTLLRAHNDAVGEADKALAHLEDLIDRLVDATPLPPQA
jgi:CHAT domain